MEPQEEEYESPYCPICTGCGEEGCCSPVHCTQDVKNGCLYPETNLAHLKYGYLMHKEMWDLIPKDPETQAKLDEIFNRNYDLIYKQ